MLPLDYYQLSYTGLNVPEGCLTMVMGFSAVQAPDGAEGTLSQDGAAHAAT